MYYEYTDDLAAGKKPTSPTTTYNLFNART